MASLRVETPACLGLGRVDLRVRHVLGRAGRLLLGGRPAEGRCQAREVPRVWVRDNVEILRNVRGALQSRADPAHDDVANLVLGQAVEQASQVERRLHRDLPYVAGRAFA
jgi:hypothetical protein